VKSICSQELDPITSIAMQMNMSTVALVALLIAVPASAFNFQVTATSTLAFDVEGAKNRPVSKVVTLLKDMQAQLEKEGEEDEEIYETMACWCATNDKEKTKSIKDAEARISDLTTSIEELTAASSRLTTEIANLEKEVLANQQALDKATAMRAKELAEFTAEEKDVLQSITALKSAVVVLSKHHGGALLQELQGPLMKVARTMHNELNKHAAVFEGVITKSQRRAVAAFVVSPEDYFSAMQTSKKSKYAPASGEIFGILKQMKETFETNLAASQKDEANSQKAYEELKAAKEEEIAAGSEQIGAKTQELAMTDEKLAQDKQDLDDTQGALTADEKFLMNLKETCAMTDKEWELRQKERQLEIEAVSKALAILSSDDAHDLFTKTFNFIQRDSSTGSKRRTQASKLLSAVAKKTNNPKLMTLALSVKLDAFKRVIKAIDDMTAQLIKEKEDEIKHKDYCVANFNENERTTELKEREKKDKLALIEDLTMTIDTLTKAIETLKAEIAEMQTQMKRAGEDRAKENKDFQATVADQRATQKLLQQAMDVLKSVYAKKASLFQRQEPPAGFKKMEKNKSGGGVIGMIQQIIDDAKAMEADAIRSEEEAQKSYEDFVKDTNGSIEEKGKEVVNKSEAKATAEGDKTQAEEERDNILLELEQLGNENSDLHKACDFVIKNFEIRQTARDEEIEALKQAKAILSGAKFSQFLQR